MRKPAMAVAGTVLAILATAAAHAPTAGTRRTDSTGTCSRGAWVCGGFSQNVATAANADIAATARNGSRRPPISYNHPPSDGPIT